MSLTITDDIVQATGLPELESPTLGAIGRLDLLQAVYGGVEIPSAVRDEVLGGSWRPLASSRGRHVADPRRARWRTWPPDPRRE